MPELPEVETVVRDLNRRVKGRRILDVWTDWPKYFKLPKGLAAFKKCVRGRKILGAARRGKNILIRLSGDYWLLIHQKISGHLLLGKWEKRPRKEIKNFSRGRQETWRSVGNSKEMNDPKNRFIRLIFFLDGSRGQNMLALSDLRRFAKVLCGPEEKILNSSDLKNLGPEALEISYKEFRDKFRNKKGKIKQVLLDQNFMAGIGNIYSDEILYVAKLHPLSRAEKLKEAHLEALFKAMRKILLKGIKLKGTSTDDFRDTYGKKGNYGNTILVYQRHGRKCPRGHLIHRVKIAQRSAHFCPKCQRLVV